MNESEAAYNLDDTIDGEEPADFTEALFDERNAGYRCVLCTQSNATADGTGMRQQMDRIDHDLCGKVEDSAIFELQAEYYHEHIYKPPATPRTRAGGPKNHRGRLSTALHLPLRQPKAHAKERHPLHQQRAAVPPEERGPQQEPPRRKAQDEHAVLETMEHPQPEQARLAALLPAKNFSGKRRSRGSKAGPAEFSSF